MTTTTTLASIANQAQPAPKPDVVAGYGSVQAFELMQRVAKALSASEIVPKQYRGSTPTAIGNCIIALNMANRIGADPLMVMQNLYVVYGNVGWSAKFKIATFNTCGRFTAIQYEFKSEEGKDDWGCRAYATEKTTGTVIKSAWVTIEIAKKEGWYGKQGSKWQTMPQQMLMYRSASWLVDAYAPELGMGLKTVDEIHDIGPQPEYTIEDLMSGETTGIAVSPQITAPVEVVQPSEPEPQPEPAPVEEVKADPKALAIEEYHRVTTGHTALQLTQEQLEGMTLKAIQNRTEAVRNQISQA